MAGNWIPPFIAVLIALVVAEFAHAQILPGDPVDTGIGAAVRNSNTRPLLGISRDRQKYIDADDYDPRKTRQGSSARKSSNDPWKGMRGAGSAESIDRHRPY